MAIRLGSAVELRFFISKIGLNCGFAMRDAV